MYYTYIVLVDYMILDNIPIGWSFATLFAGEIHQIWMDGFRGKMKYETN